MAIPHIFSWKCEKKKTTEVALHVFNQESCDVDTTGHSKSNAETYTQQQKQKRCVSLAKIPGSVVTKMMLVAVFHSHFVTNWNIGMISKKYNG